MKTSYMIRASGQDILLNTHDLALPFKTAPHQTHPFLKLGDYFNNIKVFLLKDKLDELIYTSGSILGSEISPGHIQDVGIRSEKHGAFYHVASVEIITSKGRIRFALATFLSNNEDWFNREVKNLSKLAALVKPFEFFPTIYFKGRRTIKKSDHSETFYFLLTQWLEGFCEWHLHPDPRSGKCRILIWDQEDGNRFISSKQAQALFYNIAFILTLCYDPVSFSRINLWQNAAGDFVLRTEDSLPKVMLTSVRDYSPIVQKDPGRQDQLWMALTFFFLELLTLIRTDRKDGMGDILWCEDWCFPPAISGFFDALKVNVKWRGLSYEVPFQFLEFLRTFKPQEIGTLLQYTISCIEKMDPFLSQFVGSRVATHANELSLAIQRYQI